MPAQLPTAALRRMLRHQPVPTPLVMAGPRWWADQAGRMMLVTWALVLSGMLLHGGLNQSGLGYGLVRWVMEIAMLLLGASIFVVVVKPWMLDPVERRSSLNGDGAYALLTLTEARTLLELAQQHGELGNLVRTWIRTGHPLRARELNVAFALDRILTRAKANA